MSTLAAHAPIRPHTRGPLELVVEIVLGLMFVALFAWFIGLAIEIGGSFTIWKHKGVAHAQTLVQQDLRYIAAAPRSLLIEDTVGFSQQLLDWVEAPYRRLGVINWYLRHHDHNGAATPPVANAGAGIEQLSRGLGRATTAVSGTLSRWLVLSMFVAQDVLLRLSVALFALPAFVLACLVGTVDGLVRRDLRRWGGGRESSFVYHHAKRYTVWSLTGGFALYLSWPFGGFNPAYMVLVFTVLVAATLSTTVAAFKKYV